MKKEELIAQTKNAFDFIQKLYFEVSYLIKEVEGLLSEEEEEFVIGRATGYAIVARSSNGLEPSFVNFWMYRNMTAFFIPKNFTHYEKGQTITRFEDNPRIFCLRIVLDDTDLPEPSVYFGAFYDFKNKRASRFSKVEQCFSTFAYGDKKIFRDYKKIEYEDAAFIFKGKLARTNLYDINSSGDVYEKIIKPGLKLFREL